MQISRILLMLLFWISSSGCNHWQRNGALARMGNRRAMYEYGIELWEHTTGRKDEVDEAIRWITKAAQKGETEAMYRLAMIHGGGSGLTEPHPQAISWFRKAAEAGDRPSMIKLAEAYRYGWLGLPVDQGEARKWYDSADRARKPGEM